MKSWAGASWFAESRLVAWPAPGTGERSLRVDHRVSVACQRRKG